MNPIKKLIKNLRDNVAELYTLFVIILGLPFALSLITNIKWGLLLSFVSQAVIGLLYIKGSNK